MNYLQIVANHVVKLDIVNSTNEYAIYLLANNEPKDGTVITASFQTNGKGQYGREWQSEPNQNILMSLILFPKGLSVDNVFLLTMTIALAVRSFISQYVKEIVTIKWPNDIYIGDEKIGGILIQNQINSKGVNTSIIGIGLNVNQSSFELEKSNPTSLNIQTNSNYQLDKLYPILYKSLDEYYLKLRIDKSQLIKDEYISNLYRFNTITSFLIEDKEILEGRIVGISDNGSIVIRNSYGQQSYMMHELKMII